MKPTIVSLAIAGAVFAACNPTPYEVKREILIDAPVDVVYAEVNNFKNFVVWSPWEDMDPEMTKTYEGPDDGVGAKYSWVGNDSVGTGYMEITESVPNQRVVSNLVFTEPWESESVNTWTLEDTPEGTKAIWTVKGELPAAMFWMGQEDMDETMGPTFDDGLGRLKAIAEAKVPESPFTAEERDVTAQPYFFVTDEVSWSDIGPDYFDTRYGKIMAHLGADSGTVTAPPFAIYHVWDEENQKAKISVGMASSSAKKAKGEINKDMTYNGKTLMVQHFGDFANTETAHIFLVEEIEKKGYEIAGSPWEVYVTNPAQEPDTMKWLSEIYYPVVPKATVN